MGSGLLEDQKEVLLLIKCISFHCSNYEQRGVLSNKAESVWHLLKGKLVSG